MAHLTWAVITATTDEN